MALLPAAVGSTGVEPLQLEQVRGQTHIAVQLLELHWLLVEVDEVEPVALTQHLMHL